MRRFNNLIKTVFRTYIVAQVYPSIRYFSKTDNEECNGSCDCDEACETCNKEMDISYCAMCNKELNTNYSFCYECLSELFERSI